MKKGIILALFLSLLLTVPVLAASYSATITVTESGSISYAMLPLIAPIDNQNLADLHIMTSTGLDTRVLQGFTELPHMVADDKVLFALPVSASTQYPLEYTFGNTPLASFPVITGRGGYVTIADHADLELGMDFEMEFEAWLGHSVAPTPVVAATESSVENAQTNSHDIDLPSGVAAGDLLIMLFSAYDPESAGLVITWPSGWTELNVLASGGGASVHGCAYKVAVGTEGSSAIVTLAGGDTGYSAHQTFRITNYVGLPQCSADVDGSSVSPNAATLTSSFSLLSGQDVLWLTFFGGCTAAITVSSYPTDYSNGTLTQSTAGYSSVASALRYTETTSENAGAFTLSGSLAWAAWTIGIEGASTSLAGKTGSCAVNIDGSDLYASLIDASYYYYKESIYQDDWTTGSSVGSGSQSKEPDHLRLQAVNTSAERTYVLSSPVDLTDVDTLYIDWANNGSAVTQNCAFLVVSTNQTGNYATYNYRLQHLNTFTRTVGSLDVSAASGNYYIRIHAWVNAGAYTSEVNAFNIYGTSGDDIVLQVSGFAEGERVVSVWHDGVTFGIDIDGVTENSTACAHYGAGNNTNSWVISNLSYFNYYEHTVSGALRLTYQPDSLIIGTTLPNEENPGTCDGTITWGSNPSGVSVSMGALLPVVSSTAVTPGTTPDAGASLVPATGNTSALVSGIEGENLPFYGLFKGLFDSYHDMGGPDIQMPYFWKLVAMIIGWGLGTVVLIATRHVVLGFLGYIIGFAVPAYYMGGLLDPWIPIVYGMTAACLAALLWKWTASAMD